MSGRVHVLGTVVLDRVYHVDVLPGHDEKAFATAREETPGGPAAYVASAVAGWGRRARLHAVLGADPAGDLLVARLAGRGVETTALVRDPAASTAANVIVVDRSGEKAVIIEPIAEPVLARFGAGIAFSAGDALVTHLFHPDAVAHAAAAARQAGAAVLADLEMPEIERWGFERALAASRDADILCTNGQVLEAQRGPVSAKAAAELARTLAQGRRAACVTLGAAGSIVHAAGRTLRIPALAVRPRNTTGAGDTFIAALACATADGMPPGPAALCASAAAGLFLAGEAADWAAVVARAETLTATPFDGHDAHA